MPKDEDILQLVSLVLLSEVEGPWGLGAQYAPSLWASFVHWTFWEAH